MLLTNCSADLDIDYCEHDDDAGVICSNFG